MAQSSGPARATAPVVKERDYSELVELLARYQSRRLDEQRASMPLSQAQAGASATASHAPEQHLISAHQRQRMTLRASSSSRTSLEVSTRLPSPVCLCLCHCQLPFAIAELLLLPTRKPSLRISIICSMRHVLLRHSLHVLYAPTLRILVRLSHSAHIRRVLYCTCTVKCSCRVASTRTSVSFVVTCECSPRTLLRRGSFHRAARRPAESPA